MRNRNLKRRFSLLLTLAMLVGVLPSAAFAAPEQEAAAPVSAAVETASAQNEQMEARLEKLARYYANTSQDWFLLEPWMMIPMGAYQRSHPQGIQVSSWARQNFINQMMVTLEKEQEIEDLAQILPALYSQGVDPRELYSLDSTEPIDAVELYGSLDDPRIWFVPDVLIADQATNLVNRDRNERLLNRMLDEQRADGSWSDGESTIDLTAGMITALTLYAEENDRAAQAVEKGIAYLSAIQTENGTFGPEKGDTWDSSNAMCCAEVMTALCAAGVNPHTDPRFIKNGNSLLDGLLSYELPDMGFRYRDEDELEVGATAEAFGALVAYDQVARTGKAFNVYDFRDMELAPGRAAIIENEDESVSLAVPENTRVELPIGHTGEVLVRVDGESRYQPVKKSFVGEDRTWAILSGSGDYTTIDIEINFRDVKPTNWFAKAVNFNADRGLFAGVDSPEGKNFLPDLAMNRAMVVTVLRSLEDGYFFGDLDFVDVKEGDWFADSVGWAKEFGITSGVDAIHFAPNAQLTRQELALMLYRYAEKLGMDVSSRADLSGYADYDKVDGWAAGGMAWAVDSGIISGVGGNRLAPTTVVTRCQAAQMMMKLVMNMIGYEESQLDAAMSGVRTYLNKTIQRPQAGEVLGGEWVITGLARSGNELTEGYFQQYYDDLVRYVKENRGVLHERKYTEYSRTVLALSAIGADPRNVGGYDLLAPLADYDKTVWQGPNGAVWALIALNSGSYKMPQGTATIRKYVDKVLADQLADGGWSMTGRAPGDPDLTAMALQALAEYQGQSEVDDAVEKALNFLSGVQTADGSFIANQVSNAESCAQVIIALNSLDIPLTDTRFVKNGRSALDALLTFRNDDGGFRHVKDGKTDQMATEQALLALASAWRWEHGKSDLYTMDDVTIHVK